ncbi:plastocyanin/azurin family copper-binding protein [Membranihabitans maritimus]|uniref:plastocyanin/azurin family copper-binding protein n=1 Tax=Membranihabitans maritimus TaxID=2904244 RepID=UPI001F01A9D1|nr:plastocyanin/azurin family copper-binding protein [Membranihabitans maritimus]
MRINFYKSTGFLFVCSMVFSLGLFAQDFKIQEVVIKAVGGLQYDRVRFQVPPGSQVRLLFQNTDDMDHNLLITDAGKRKEVVEAAFQLAADGPAKEFIPESTFILESIGVVSPGEEEVLEFRAPEKEGVYPYVCTYPGHGTIMYGAMYVTEKELPPLAGDMNVPEHRRQEGVHSEMGMAHDHHKSEKQHPYDIAPPNMYRIFMPDSGPASIAVHLTEGLSYCWDAIQCRLRYIWDGGFLDISEPWSIKGDARAKLLGEKIYIEEQLHPLQMGDGDQVVEYLGYQLTKEGYPEFYYLVNGIRTFERIRPLREEYGIERRFRMENLPATMEVNFYWTKGLGVKTVTKEGEVLNLPGIIKPGEVPEFVIHQIFDQTSKQ